MFWNKTNPLWKTQKMSILVLQFEDYKTRQGIKSIQSTKVFRRTKKNEMKTNSIATS